MQRIDVASSVAALPAPAAAVQPGFFTDGDPVGGSPATVVDADWLNGVQEELVGVILGAGAALAKADNTQLLTALKALFGVTGNLAATGHATIRIGNAKLVLNWGSGSNTDNTGTKGVAFDQPFAAAPFVAFATNAASGPPSAFHGTGAMTANGMTVYSSTSSGNAAASGTAFNWFAIGLGA